MDGERAEVFHTHLGQRLVELLLHQQKAVSDFVRKAMSFRSLKPTALSSLTSTHLWVFLTFKLTAAGSLVFADHVVAIQLILVVNSVEIFVAPSLAHRMHEIAQLWKSTWRTLDKCTGALVWGMASAPKAFLALFLPNVLAKVWRRPESGTSHSFYCRSVRICPQFSTCSSLRDRLIAGTIDWNVDSEHLNVVIVIERVPYVAFDQSIVVGLDFVPLTCPQIRASLCSGQARQGYTN